MSDPNPVSKPVRGFYLSFGYVEDGRVARILIYHLKNCFETVDIALMNLAHTFLDDWMEGERQAAKWEQREPEFTLGGFEEYLQNLPNQDASASDPFLWSYCNSETWWAWDNLSTVYPILDQFYENDQFGAEELLPLALKPDLYPIQFQDEAFKQEVLEQQRTAPSYLKSPTNWKRVVE